MKLSELIGNLQQQATVCADDPEVLIVLGPSIRTPVAAATSIKTADGETVHLFGKKLFDDTAAKYTRIVHADGSIEMKRKASADE